MKLFANIKARCSKTKFSEKKLRYLSALFLTLVLIAITAYDWVNKELHKPFSIDSAATFDVQKGSSMTKIGYQLADKGWIQYPWLARIAFEMNPSLVPKAGKYNIEPGTNILQFFEFIHSGETIYYPITFLEGQTYKDYLAAMEKAGNIEITLKGLSGKEIAEQMGLDKSSPEGLIFANTYRYHDGDTDLQILQRANQLLVKTLDEEWQKKAAKLPYKDAYEALIMASIIEKETGVPSERPLISRVFVSRLQKGMKLQTDPTVIYGMGDKYKGNISRSDLKTPTPYNTYHIDGLPPTPIANVGYASIHAALNPGETKALFFVANGDGSHVFSNTLEEHNNAVAQYQKNHRRKDYKSSPEQ